LAHALKDGVIFQEFVSILQFRFLQFWATYKAHQFKVPISKKMQQQLYYPSKNRCDSIFAANNNFLSNEEKTDTRELKSIEPLIFDITRTLSAEIPVWPGSQSFELRHHKFLEQDGVNDSSISMNLHTGTHVDAPKHFVKDGDSVDRLRLEKMIGTCLVIEFLQSIPIDENFLKEHELLKSASRVLFKTLNSARTSKNATFQKDFIAITSQAAEFLVEQGVQLVGIDGPSIQKFDDQTNSTHEILLKNKVIILENLDLSKVAEGFYHLTALPLKIANAEAAPIRAILTREIVT
jgi:arylformamidase